MITYIARRILWIVPVLFTVSILTFIVLYGWQLWWGTTPPTRLLICVRCFELFSTRPGPAWPGRDER